MPFPAYLLTKSDDVIRAEVTELSERDLPSGDVLIAVEWSVINFKDAMVTQPGNRVARRYPLIPGVELTGSVVESGDPALQPGQRVLVQGSFRCRTISRAAPPPSSAWPGSPRCSHSIGSSVTASASTVALSW